ncbi:class I SAM-dependent methyltransferase [Mycobacterium sp. NPDC003449]
MLGSGEVEIARLQSQAAFLAAPTALLLQRGGIRPGMRVLDLGSGPGDVSFQVAEMVGPDGFVVGVDSDPAQIAVAERRLSESDMRNIAFRLGDARTFTDEEPFDAIVCRLLLMHLPAAVDVLTHHKHNLHPGGLVVVIDYDGTGSRTLPEVALHARILKWLRAGFEHAHADVDIGMRLPALFAQAGLSDVEAIGIQPYWAPENRHAAAYLVSAVYAMKDAIVASGIATEEELGLHTLEQRLVDALTSANAVWTLPTVVGGWGRCAR